MSTTSTTNTMHSLTTETTDQTHAVSQSAPSTDTGLAPVTTRRAWAWAGVAAGAAAIVSIAASMQIDAVYSPEAAGDPDAIVGLLADQTAAILTFHTATMVLDLPSSDQMVRFHEPPVRPSAAAPGPKPSSRPID